jgi:molybdate transport system substrate-binding protein
MHRLFHVMALLFVSLLLAACTPVQPPGSGTAPRAAASNATRATLHVFAAASLTDAFNQIGNDFTVAHPGVDVVFNFAGSNELATQIRSGAPADLFASANAAQMTVAIDSGRIVSGTERAFVQNRLVVIAPSNNPAGLNTLEDLARPGIAILVAASEVPVGRYTLDFLDKAEADGSLGEGYKDAVIANIVSYEQNVRAVLTKVSLGEADAGVVYTSDVGAAAEEVIQIAIPDNLNTIASYPIAPLSDSAHPELAQQFLDYLLSPAGQQVLVEYGFISISEDTSSGDTGGTMSEGS